MRAQTSIGAALILASAFAFGATQDQPASSGPVVSELAKSYGTVLKKITDKEVLVSPELAVLCVGVSPARLAEASRTFGPHANCAINIFMNDLAEKAFAGNAEKYPIGSVIVKEKRAGQFNGVGGMVKRGAGFDSEHGDWEYFYFDTPASIEQGRIASCVGCHSSARSSDYVFGSWSGERAKSVSAASGDGEPALHDLRASARDQKR